MPAQITDDDFEALASGLTTQAELAHRHGISKQAVSKRFARWRAGQAAPTTSTTGATSTTVPVELNFDPLDPHASAVAALHLVIIRAHQLLGRPDDPPPLGASALKATAAAIMAAVEGLERLGVVGDQGGAHEELVLRIMSPADEARLRADVEAAASAAHGEIADDED